MTRVEVDIRKHRSDPTARSWELPPWGHVLSKGVLPLFMKVEGRLFPLGTAYWLGGGVPFVMTAMHCILEAMRHEPHLERLAASGDLPAKAGFKEVALYVLHQDSFEDGRGKITFLPLESIDAGPPGDVAFGYPMFEAGRPRWSLPISFDPPRIGSTVWSLGYTAISPTDGIPWDDVQSGAFDWATSYSHRFVVTEGVVTRIFTQRFATGFNGGPCFAFDAEIDHGQSGGPIITPDGRVVGLNSATASSFFEAPMSLGSMFYPLLLTGLKFGLGITAPGASLRFDNRIPLIELIGRGAIATDGSERNVALHQVPGQDGWAIGPRVPRDDHEFVHADFRAMLDGTPNEKLTDYHRFVRTPGIPAD